MQCVNLTFSSQHTESKPGTGDAFEDVLYSSEDDLDSDDSDEGSRSKGGHKAKERGFRLPVDNEEPMDLLHGAISRIAGGLSSR
jgi:ribosomal RNA-processing protein 12